MNADVFCSTGRAEPLPGTAKTGKIFLAIEHAHGWGHDVMDGDAFGPEVTQQLASYLKRMGATVQLIRKVGREGQQRTGTTVFVAFTEVGVVEKLMISDITQLWDIDISAPGRSGGDVVDHPVVLVCTHGKRDRCCALKGRPCCRPDLCLRRRHHLGILPHQGPPLCAVDHHLAVGLLLWSAQLLGRDRHGAPLATGRAFPARESGAQLLH